MFDQLKKKQRYLRYDAALSTAVCLCVFGLWLLVVAITLTTRAKLNQKNVEIIVTAMISCDLFSLIFF